MKPSPNIVDLSATGAGARERLYAQLRGLNDDNCTYFLCPDRACRLFMKPDCHVPCDRACPRRAKKAIVCHSCRAPIILPYEHFSFCRVDCACGAANFQRMSSRYRRHDVDASAPEAGPMQALSEFQRLQIEQAASGCFSGSLDEWPVLYRALIAAGVPAERTWAADRVVPLCRLLMQR